MPFGDFEDLFQNYIFGVCHLLDTARKYNQTRTDTRSTQTNSSEPHKI
jgi:hypothetical protein